MARDIIQDFVNKRIPRGHEKPYGSYGHIYYEGDILYDYGHHFPMLIRHKWGYLLNADKYSNTTSKHQGMCRGVATVQIPLSALRQANIPYTDFNLIDSSKQREDILGYYKRVENPNAKTMTVAEHDALEWHKRRGYNADNREHPTIYIWQASRYKIERISIAQYQSLSESEREEWTEKTERRPQHDVISYKGKYYLSGMDGQNYFLCRLPRKVKIVDEAFEILKPEAIRLFVGKVLRQGEWFFIPVERDAKKEYAKMTRDYVLPKTDERSHSHTATRGIKIGKDIFVSGSIRHSEHGTLHLSKSDNPIIFQVFKNTARQSFSVNGRVD
jgi:hypothetical protein